MQLDVDRGVPAQQAAALLAAEQGCTAGAGAGAGEESASWQALLGYWAQGKRGDWEYAPAQLLVIWHLIWLCSRGQCMCSDGG